MKKNYLFQFIFSLGLLVVLFTPIFIINGNSRTLIELIFQSKNIGMILVSSSLLVSLIATNVLTYFEKFTEIKLGLSLLGLIVLAFAFTIFEKTSPDIVIDPLAGYFLLLAAFISLTILFCRNFFENNRLFIADIVEIAVFVAIAIILDLPFLKVKIVANGGSISLVMLPLIFVSLRKGAIKGFIASGILFGLITCLTDGYGFATYPFDYLIGFGSCALIGLFKKPIFGTKKSFIKYLIFILGSLLVFLVRLMGSTISGSIIYGLDFGGSIIYNLTYLGPSFIATMIVGVLLLPIFLQIMKKYSN